MTECSKLQRVMTSQSSLEMLPTPQKLKKSRESKRVMECSEVFVILSFDNRAKFEWTRTGTSTNLISDGATPIHRRPRSRLETPKR